jgi:hypothetical protein
MSTQSHPSPTLYLFRPFRRIAGLPSLALGVALILLTSWVGSLTGVHFDGVLDTHAGPRGPLWLFMGEGLINWISLALPLYAAGRLLSNTKFRFIDLVGTQALARWPMVLASLACLTPGFHRFSAKLLEFAQKMAGGASGSSLPLGSGDGITFILVTFAILLCTIWMVALMWHSFAHCCNLRGGKAVGGFVAVLILAEIISKVLIAGLFQLV